MYQDKCYQTSYPEQKRIQESAYCDSPSKMPVTGYAAEAVGGTIQSLEDIKNGAIERLLRIADRLHPMDEERSKHVGQILNNQWPKGSGVVGLAQESGFRARQVNDLLHAICDHLDLNL